MAAQMPAPLQVEAQRLPYPFPWMTILVHTAALTSYFHPLTVLALCIGNFARTHRAIPFREGFLVCTVIALGAVLAHGQQLAMLHPLALCVIGMAIADRNQVSPAAFPTWKRDSYALLLVGSLTAMYSGSFFFTFLAQAAISATLNPRPVMNPWR